MSAPDCKSALPCTPPTAEGEPVASGGDTKQQQQQQQQQQQKPGGGDASWREDRWGLLDELTRRVHDKVPTVFVKYGDGEFNCARGQIGVNCDKDPYSASLSVSLRRSFVELSLNPNCFMAEWRSDEAMQFWQSISLGGRPRSAPLVVYKTLLVDPDALGNDKLLRFFESIKQYDGPKLLVSNRLLMRAASLLQTHHRIVDVRGWFSEGNLADIVQTALHLHKTNASKAPVMVLTMCGMGAKPLLAAISQTVPQSLCFDLGSSLDFLCTKRDTRGWSKPPHSMSYEAVANYFKPLLPPDWESARFQRLFDQARIDLGVHLPF